MGALLIYAFQQPCTSLPTCPEILGWDYAFWDLLVLLVMMAVPQPYLPWCNPGLLPQLSSIQGVQWVSAEKQTPSPIDCLGALKQAVEVERRVSKSGVSKALRDVVSRCVGEYNRMVTLKKHRIDSTTKSLVMNLPLGKLFAMFFPCLLGLVQPTV